MSHRAKHLRRNWAPDRVANASRDRKSSTTAKTTGFHAAYRAALKRHRKLPVLRWLGVGQ